MACPKERGSLWVHRDRELPARFAGHGGAGSDGDQRGMISCLRSGPHRLGRVFGRYDLTGDPAAGGTARDINRNSRDQNAKRSAILRKSARIATTHREIQSSESDRRSRMLDHPGRPLSRSFDSTGGPRIRAPFYRSVAVCTHCKPCAPVQG